jgi:uncharacterized repeat protein (TIGR01451 family)
MPDSIIQEGEQVTVYQSDMDIGISGLPSMIDACGTYTVTLTLTNTQATVDAYDVEVFFPTGNYGIDLGSVSYGGVTPGSGPTYTTVPSEGYLWEYGDNFTGGTNGTITFDITKRCGQGSGCGATVSFDDLCNDDDTSDAVCTESTSVTPYLVNATIFIKKVPELVYATTNQATWKVYVVNAGSGSAYNVWVDDILGADLQYTSSSAEDLLGTPVVFATNPNQDHNGTSINGVSWVFDQIPAGKGRIITLTADIIGCDPADLTNDVSASWGCLGADCQTPVTDHSTVSIPPANAVTLNILPANIDLCEQDAITVQVKNAGITTVYDVTVELDLPQGLQYVPGTGVPAPDDPSADPLVWTAVFPSIDPGVIEEVSIDVVAGCDFPDGNRTIISKASYETVCGEVRYTPESRSTLAVREPDISIVKDGRNLTTGSGWANTVNAEPGDTVEWRISIENNGAVDAQNVEFWDLLPSNMTLTSGPGLSGSGTQADPWVHGILQTGHDVTHYIQATVDADECTENPTTNRACVWYGCDDNPTTPNVDPCREPETCDNGRLRTTAHFTISQILGTITTCDGDITVTVTNNGPPAYNVKITSDLPVGFVYDSMIFGSNPTPDPPADPTQPVWDIGTMDEGEAVTLQFSIITDGTSCDTVIPDTNTVYVDFDNACDQHYQRSNSRNVTPLKPVLTVSKTPETVTRPPGGTTTWTITVQNTGNYPAENVEVVDDLSLNFFNIVANNGSGGEVPSIVGNTVTWNIASILVGGTWTATLSADITGALGTDTVTVNGYCSTGCIYTTAADEAYVQTIEGIFKSPDLQTATIGEEITFTISSSYWGTSDYQNVQIIDTLPAGLVYVTSTYSDTLGLSPPPVVVGQTITWTLGNFTGPNTVDVTVTARVQNVPGNVDGVTLTNEARTVGSEEGVPFDLSDSGDVTIIEPDLTIDKVGSITEGLPGDTIHYTITVQNTGTSPAYDVAVEDVVPTGLILDTSSITSTPGADTTTRIGSTIIWEYVIIPVGGMATLAYDATIPTEGGVFTNTATITEYSSLLDDSPYERDYPPGDDSWTVRAPGTDILKITLNTEVDVPSPGGVVYFELTIENTGAMPLDPVKLIDIIPDGLTYALGTAVVGGISYEPDSVVDNIDGTQTLTWNDIQPPPDPMDPGGVIVVTFEATVDPDRVGTFINTAIVIGTSTIGDVSDEDDSPVGVKAPAITIVKVIDPSVTSSGEIVEIRLRVTNTGEVPLDPVEVVDVLPVGLTYAGEADPSLDVVTLNTDETTTLIWNNVGPLGVGESTTLTFNALFNGKENESLNTATATGTPPNGSPVSDDDTASVTVPSIPTSIWKVLAYNGLYRCTICDIDDLVEEAREIGLEFSNERDNCCMPDDLIETLREEIERRGLDTDPRYEQVQELLAHAEEYCEKAFRAYTTGKYIETYQRIHKRCGAYREAIELMIEILSEV